MPAEQAVRVSRVWWSLVAVLYVPILAWTIAFFSMPSRGVPPRWLMRLIDVGSWVSVTLVLLSLALITGLGSWLAVRRPETDGRVALGLVAGTYLLFLHYIISSLSVATSGAGVLDILTPVLVWGGYALVATSFLAGTALGVSVLRAKASPHAWAGGVAVGLGLMGLWPLAIFLAFGAAEVLGL